MKGPGYPGPFFVSRGRCAGVPTLPPEPPHDKRPRTHDDTRTNHGTIFRLGEDGVLAPVARIGGGSEVEALAVEPSVAAPS